MNALKSQRLSELVALLHAEEDQQSERGKSIARAIYQVSSNPDRWWDEIGVAFDAEGLIRRYMKPRTSR